MSTKQSQFKQSKFQFTAQYNAKSYFDRTSRNHFWLGGKEGQETIRRLKIGVAGLGGMGSSIAELLARLGVGHLRVADPDTIDVSNINRQVIAFQNTVGKTKLEASIFELRNIGHDFDLVGYDQGITKEVVDEFVDGLDIIIDEIDVFPMDKHVLLHQAAVKRQIPVYSCFVVGGAVRLYKFDGDAYTFENWMTSTRFGDWRDPSLNLIAEKIANPIDKYLEDALMNDIKLKGYVPIFGPTVQLGHSLVVNRLVVDVLKKENVNVEGSLASGLETPLMPEYIIADLNNLKISIEKFK